MKYHWKITLAAMMLIVVAFYFSSRNYIFNKQNDFGGLVFISTTLNIWSEKSPSDYNFCPVLTFTNSGDKFITYYKRLEDKEGNNYFVSQPPFQYIFAYYFITLSQLPFNFLSIRLMNFLLLVCGSVLVYFIVNLITKKKILEFSLSAIIGMTAFLFFPINSYTAASNYAPEFIFWLAGIFFFISLVRSEVQKFYHLLLFGLSVFLVCYTDWIGFFFSASILLYCIFRIRNKLFLRISAYALIFSVLSLLLTYIQFSSLNGTGEMIHAMKLRFLSRSGIFGATLSEMGINIYSFSSWLTFLQKLNNSFIGFGYLMILFLIIYLVTKRNIPKQQNVFIFVFFPVILPVIIHFIILFNSNAIHQYYMAKAAVPVSILLGVLFNLLNQNHLFGLKKALMLLLVILTVLISLLILPIKFPIVSDNAVAEIQGTYIHEHSLPHEAVFISRDTTNDFFADFYLTFISKRNLRYAEGLEDAKMIVKGLYKTNGVYHELHEDTSKCKTFHFVIADSLKNKQ